MASFQQTIKESGMLNEQQYREVQKIQSEKRSTFYYAVKSSGFIGEDTLLNYACSFFGCKRIGNAFTVEVNYDATDKVMGSVFEAITARAFAIMLDDKLAFVVSDPENETFRKKIISALGVEPTYVLISAEEFGIILQYQLTPRAISAQADKIKVTASQGNEGSGGPASQETASYTQKLLEMLIDAAISKRASDLHLTPLGHGVAQVALRIDGILYPYSQIKADILPNLRNRLKTMSKVGGDTLDAPVEGQISVTYKGKKIDIRINIVKAVLGYDFNLRFIDESLKGLDELGISEENLESYLRLLHMTKGLVILCGPTGSGKTTLLYAGLKKLVNENKAIFTIEDPVEIVLPSVTQLEVQKEKGMSYESLFPSALRHDPDIVVLGEVRKEEVGMQVINAAETGHLVFTTVHANDAVGAIPRLVNMGIDPYPIGDVLAAVVAQRLIRRVCTECKEEYDLPEDHAWRTKYKLGNGHIRLAKGRGCAHCGGTGYYGRIAVNEIMVTTPQLRNAIQKHATHTELEQIMAENGFVTYFQDAIQKAMNGVTTFDEIDSMANDVLGYDMSSK